MKRFFNFIYNVQRVLLVGIFWGIVIGLAIMLAKQLRHPTLTGPALLQIRLDGEVVETRDDTQQSMLMQLLGMGDVQSNAILLRDIQDALKLAAQDDRIQGVLLNLQGLNKVGLSTADEIGKALDGYRARSKKSVWVWAPTYSQSQYAIAAHADHVSLHPMGEVDLKGLSSTALYWGKTIKSLGIGVDVHKAGAYKSAPEVFVAEEPSAATLEAQKSFMNAAWQTFSQRIEETRGLKPGAVNELLGSLPSTVDEHKTVADVFKSARFIDALDTMEAFWQKLVKQYSPSKKEEDLMFVTLDDYLSLFEPVTTLTADGVMVLSAEGEISSESNGGINPSLIGERLEAIRKDPHVKALVLRLNTPGGEALASEQIRNDLMTVAEKMPVIISMGDVVASGGYWIASAGQKIVANHNTITGSIGVFALSFNASGLMERYGVGRGGYKTSALADKGRVWMAPNPEVRQMIDAGVNNTYWRFKSLVSESRHMTMDAVEAVAQGRVWMGSQAVQIGLVDKLGGLSEAIILAKLQAKLPEDAQVLYDDVSERDWRSRLRKAFGRFWSQSALAELVPLGSPWSEESFVTGRPLVWAPIESSF